jgi:hypothetical protein
MAQFAIPRELLFNRIAEGNGYLVSKMQDIPSDGSANVHIRNPHSDKVMWLAGISIYAQGDVDFYLHDGFDSITDGTEITIQNALMDSGGGSPDSGPFEAYYGSSYTVTTGGTVPLGFTLSNGANSKTVDVYPSAVEPGREVVIDLENQDSQINKSLVSILLVTSY